MDLVYIRKIINNKIATNGFKTSNINDDTELLRNGYLDSLDIAEIIMELEKKKTRLNFQYDTYEEEININWFYRASTTNS